MASSSTSSTSRSGPTRPCGSGTPFRSRPGTRLSPRTRFWRRRSTRILQELEGELDLRAAVMHVRLQGASVTFVAPVSSDAWEWTLDRAIATARASRGHLTFVGSEDDWAADVFGRRPGQLPRVSPVCERAAPSARSHQRRRSSTSCLSAQPLLVPMAELAWCLDPGRLLAWGRLGKRGTRHLRAESRKRGQHRRPGRRGSELDAARGLADARRRARRARCGRQLSPPRSRTCAAATRSSEGQHGLDEQRADRRRPRPPATVPLQCRVLSPRRSRC